jgi:hypothetical protein
MRFHSPLVPTIVIAAALDTAAPARAAVAPDACSLLTTAQVSAALGVAVADGKPLTSNVCSWRESGAQTGKKVTLTILTAQGFSIGKTPLAGTEKPPVSGVGDDAFYKYFAEPRYEKIKLVDLDVKKGDKTFGVEVAGFPIDDAKAKTKTLALQALIKI